jgi:catechol 2,3-dioxygenase-like lactoylglutathione lyase family enzyme
VAFIRFSAPDLDKMEHFMLNFGMQRSHRTSDTLYMRGTGPENFVHVTHLGEPGFIGFALNATSMVDLETISKMDNVPIEELKDVGGGKVVRLTDPNGFQIEYIYGQQAVDELSIDHRPDLGLNQTREYTRKGTLQRVGPAGPAAVRRLGHVVVNVIDFAESEQWYKSRFGFISSDEVVVGKKDRVVGHFMRCDRGEEYTDHHSIFMVGAGKPSFNHAAWEVTNIDDVMLGHFHLLGTKDVEGAALVHTWGIGRHILGSQVFDYWKDPWGHTVEHWSDGDQLNSASGTNLKRPISDLLATQWGPTIIGSHL